MSQNNALIQVHNLSKVYRIPERREGVLAAVKSLVRREFKNVTAVDEVSFRIEAGEMVGFIGPNGAGKTTTLKMLAGLLYPTGGSVHVKGFVPFERKSDYLRTISMLMGNKGQLPWENTVADAFEIQAAIYHVPRKEFILARDELVELMEVKDLLPKMIRNLSLGQRMKCELIAALIYRPSILFLDEPTLGLDISMQIRLRQFLAEYNRRYEATIILTSHYMADVSALCPRVILIDHGKLIYDGVLNGLAERVAPFKLIKLTVGDAQLESIEQAIVALGQGVTMVEPGESTFTLRVEKAITATVIAHLLRELSVVDVTVEDPPLEAVIDQVYREGVTL